jgi:hypothetical protein
MQEAAVEMLVAPGRWGRWMVVTVTGVITGESRSPLLLSPELRVAADEGQTG